jgi:hypothetical protein
VDPKLVTPLLLSGVFAWAIYRRVRRTFGRQLLKPLRMQVRIGILAVVGAIVLFVSIRDMALLAALLGGLACGAVLSYFGVKHTKFEVTPRERFYTPHTYIGLLVTAMFLSRLLYRFLGIYLGGQTAAAPNQNPFDAYQKSPLTLAMFGVLIGYYILFNVGVLRRARKDSPPADTKTPH